MNLLEKISQPSHPYCSWVEISEDKKSIVSFRKTTRLIFGDNGNQYLEALGREIIVKSGIIQQKDYYTEEYPTEDKKRMDLVAKILGSDVGIVHNIIEFKNMSSESPLPNIKQMVESGFNQIKDKYINGKSHSKHDFFVSVIITDVEKLIDAPVNLEKYLTTSSKKKAIDHFSIFKKYGIYIETRRYSSVENEIKSDKKWLSIPVYCVFEIIPSNNFLKENRQISRLSHAIKFPSSSNEFGIKNVRDVKDPTIFASKRTLLNDVLDTSIKSHFEKDKNLLANTSKEKDFMFVVEDSIYTRRELDKGRIQGVISTLNGAIIDGQNSLDCFHIILKATNDLIVNGSKSKIGNQEGWYIKLKEKIWNTFSNQSELESFIRNIEDSFIFIKATEAKDINQAKSFAIGKNNTMQVSKEELDIANSLDRVQLLSQEILESNGVVLNYPKKGNIGISKKMLLESSVHVSEVSLFSSNTKTISNKNFTFDSKSIFNLVQQLNNKNANKIKEFVDLYTFKDSSTISPEEIKLNKKIEDIKIEIRAKNKEIVKIKEDLIEAENDMMEATEQPVKLYCQGKMEKIEDKLMLAESELSMLVADKDSQESKRKNIIHTEWQVKDVKSLINLINSILLTKKIVKESELTKKIIKKSESESSKDSIDVGDNNIFQSVEYTINFIFTLVQLKNKIDFTNKEFTETQVNNMVNNLISMSKWFNENKFSLTDIRNSQEGTVADKEDKILTKEAVRQKMFGFLGLTV